jgi:hypothetical protein
MQATANSRAWSATLDVGFPKNGGECALKNDSIFCISILIWVISVNIQLSFLEMLQSKMDA